MTSRRLSTFDGGFIAFGDDSVAIFDGNETEIVYWVRDEWIEDPECAQAILEAINLAVTQGVRAVKAKLASG